MALLFVVHCILNSIWLHVLNSRNQHRLWKVTFIECALLDFGVCKCVWIKHKVFFFHLQRAAACIWGVHKLWLLLVSIAVVRSTPRSISQCAVCIGLCVHLHFWLFFGWTQREKPILFSRLCVLFFLIWSKLLFFWFASWLTDCVA